MCVCVCARARVCVCVCVVSRIIMNAFSSVRTNMTHVKTYAHTYVYLDAFAGGKCLSICAPTVTFAQTVVALNPKQ